MLVKGWCTVSDQQRLDDLLAQEPTAAVAANWLLGLVGYLAGWYVTLGGNLDNLREIVKLRAKIELAAVIDEGNPPGPDRIATTVATWFTERLIDRNWAKYVKK